jgi:hypothetical protein
MEKAELELGWTTKLKNEQLISSFVVFSHHQTW